MAQTALKTSLSLGIRLADQSSVFAPGDTITGHVFRGTHIVTPEAIVTVALFGRVKTKAISPLGNKSSRQTLIDEQTSVQTIFRGPLHIPNSPSPDEVEQKWPFAIVIPAHVGGEQAFPGTFTTDRPGFTSNDRALIEFGVTAELQFTENGTARMVTTTLPVTIRALSLDPPIADFQHVRHRIYGWVSSSNLLPAAPSFSMRAKMRFSSSTRPTFAGHLEVDSPTIIQLEHPDATPLRLRFVPDTKVMSSSGLYEVPGEIELTSLTMEVQATTKIGGDDADSPQATFTPSPVFMRVWSPLALGPGTPSLHIPYSTDNPALNIGELANLRMGYGGLIGKRFSQGIIYPSFAMRNINHAHRVVFNLQARISKEVLDFKWETDMDILPPSDSRGPAVAWPTNQALQSGSPSEMDEELPPVYQES
ncbi:hypothetical protein B0T11DRAFT_269882 [Plectosphaerella cucumerina]|uniref:Arrestin-like N-terminal domain-containing protein n=1 Tax=Plectosphaerella cucumerina TaxID=40658 RepID=A0A8K0TUR4_9PEZI|nr:hypothetical protein B0T11DRAFT_269882 [Plectosphaerella cucumerina]